MMFPRPGMMIPRPGTMITPPFALRALTLMVKRKGVAGTFYNSWMPVAHKNLLKIILSNKHCTLQLITNRGETSGKKHGEVLLTASTMEPVLKESLGLKWSGNQKGAEAVALLLAQRMKELDLLKLTYERHNQPRGELQTYYGKTKTIVDTLKQNGIFFVQSAHKPGLEATAPEPGEKPKMTCRDTRQKGILLRAQTGHALKICMAALATHEGDSNLAEIALKEMVWTPHVVDAVRHKPGSDLRTSNWNPYGKSGTFTSPPADDSEPAKGNVAWQELIGMGPRKGAPLKWKKR